jgi:hypothetical protein
VNLINPPAEAYNCSNKYLQVAVCLFYLDSYYSNLLLLIGHLYKRESSSVNIITVSAQEVKKRHITVVVISQPVISDNPVPRLGVFSLVCHSSLFSYSKHRFNDFEAIFTATIPQLHRNYISTSRAK